MVVVTMTMLTGCKKGEEWLPSPDLGPISVTQIPAK